MNGRSCSPKHGPGLFTVLKNLFIWMVRSFLKILELMVWLCSPKHGPVLFTVLMIFFLDVLQPCKNIQVQGWAALSNISCHGPAHFAALKTHFVLMLSRFSTTFKWTAGRAPPNTVQPISRCWRLFWSGWYEASQKHSNLWLGLAPPNTAQFCSRCGRTFSPGCYAAN